ncbi:MAG TPA: hypothetical protein PLS50_07040 [Candidatus Dojkabacteria bacterium]|nr:hypothetical protein [Candidatus Dojkabacteria bacterium]
MAISEESEAPEAVEPDFLFIQEEIPKSEFQDVVTEAKGGESHPAVENPIQKAKAKDQLFSKYVFYESYDI